MTVQISFAQEGGPGTPKHQNRAHSHCHRMETPLRAQSLYY